MILVRPRDSNFYDNSLRFVLFSQIITFYKTRLSKFRVPEFVEFRDDFSVHQWARSQSIRFAARITIRVDSPRMLTPHPHPQQRAESEDEADDPANNILHREPDAHAREQQSEQPPDADEKEDETYGPEDQDRSTLSFRNFLTLIGIFMVLVVRCGGSRDRRI